MKTLFSFFKTYGDVAFKFIITFIILFGVLITYRFFHDNVDLHDDNPFEEALELDFKIFTGYDVDVTPHSPEI